MAEEARNCLGPKCYAKHTRLGDYCSDAYGQRAYRERKAEFRRYDNEDEDGRYCEYCFGPLPARSRPNRKTCSAACRVALNRDLRQIAADG